MSTKITIGTFHSDVPFKVRRTYETASWFLDILAPAGDYPLIAFIDWRDGSPTIGHSFYAECTGPVVDGYIVSSFFGVPFGKNEATERIGATDTICQGFSPIRERAPGSPEKDCPLSAVLLPAGVTFLPGAMRVRYAYSSPEYSYAGQPAKPDRLCASLDICPDFYRAAINRGDYKLS